MEKRAKTQTPIHDLIGRRWSPRAFSGQPVEPDKLRSVLEAARWAPSSLNEQPWAYLVATREDSKGFEDLVAVLKDTNRTWAQNAPVLILTLGHTQIAKDAKPNRLGLHDLGQATANLIIQATSLGLATHQMGGFDLDAARQRFHVPAGWEPVSVIALGYPGNVEDLPEALRERERAQRSRKPLEEFVFSGTWGASFPDREFFWEQMNDLLQFVIRHGYTLVFAWVFVEQAGLPIPSAPLLLAVGALAGTKQLNLGLAVTFAVVAAVASDSMWYELGRRKGVRVLQLLCRISLEPDSCVRRTQVSFGKSGPRVLIVAKFIPGLNAMAPPLAGIIRMGWRRFLLYDVAGSLLWVGVFALTGFVFTGEIERIAASAAYLGKSLVVFLLSAFAGYIGWKYYNRRRFLHKLRIARITPEELKKKIDSGEDVIIVNLRHALEFEAQPETIPGALHMDAADLEEAYEVIPRDREIVLFCACPNEVTAARLALQLRSKGITQIRPLAGGYEGWRSRGFPLVLPKAEPQNVQAAEA